MKIQEISSDTHFSCASSSGDQRFKAGLPEGPDQSLYNWEHSGELCHHTYLWPVVESLMPRENLSVLDVGCGSGFITKRVAELGNEVIGVDASPDGIRLARLEHPGPRFEVGSAYDNLTALAPPEGWDLILGLEIIEHLFSPKRFLENMYRHLRPGGLLILSTPYHGYLKNLALSIVNGWDRHHSVAWECGHIKFFSRRSLAPMLADTNFRCVRFRYAGRLPLLWKSMVCVASRGT
jgi:2-polyprenyl-3-methyl-5-hydroxy-6-metoxy-1,4-benzoquinol methylase